MSPGAEPTAVTAPREGRRQPFGGRRGLPPSLPLMRARRLQTLRFPRPPRRRPSRGRLPPARGARGRPALVRCPCADREEHRPPLRRRSRALHYRLARCPGARHGRSSRSGSAAAPRSRSRPCTRRGTRRRSRGRPACGSAPASTSCHWTPDPPLPVGSYVMRLTIARGASKTVLGGKRPPVDRPPAGPRRTGARRRGGVPEALLRPGRADGALDSGGRSLADPAVPPLRSGDARQRAQRRDVRRAEGRPGATRLDGQAIGSRHDQRPDGQLADRALHRPADDRRRARRLRPVHPAAADPRRRAAARRRSRPTRGRPTTCTTGTATAGETPGTQAASLRSSSTAPTAIAACRHASRRTTGPSSAGSCGREAAGHGGRGRSRGGPLR